MKLQFTVDFDEVYGENFEDWVTDTYYESDTGYRDFSAEIPKAETIIYQKAFENIVKEYEKTIDLKNIEEGKRLQDEANENVKVLLDEKIESFTKDTLEDFLARTVIKTKKTGSWSDEVDEIPMTQHIEEKIDEIFAKKIYNERGKKPEYHDKTYSMIELIIQDKIEDLVTAKFDTFYREQTNKIDVAVKNTISLKLNEQYMNDNRVEEIIHAVYSELNNQTGRKEIMGVDGNE